MAEIKQLKYFANGEWKTSKTDKYMDVYNPSTGEVIAQTPCCTEAEVEEAIAAAKAGVYFTSMPNTAMSIEAAPTRNSLAYSRAVKFRSG